MEGLEADFQVVSRPAWPTIGRATRTAAPISESDKRDANDASFDQIIVKSTPS